MRAVVTGGAGFLGSHLCDYLLERGWEVLSIDNLVTGAEANVRHLAGNPRFRIVRHDVTKFIDVPGPVDYVLHFASPASPVDYLKLPIQTLKVGALGTHNSLGLAMAKKAKYFLASTSECYGDPLVSPQPETYWGHVNPIGPRGVYDEAKRFAEAIVMAYHRAHLQHLRPAHAPPRRPRSAEFCVPGAERPAHHRVWHGKANAQFLLRFRFDRRNLPSDAIRRTRAHEYRQSAGDYHSRVCTAHTRLARRDKTHCFRAPAAGRSQAALPGHFEGAPAAGLGT